MTPKFFRSRGMRKLLGNKMALVALAIIALYMGVALAVMLGVLTPEDTQARVGPNTYPAFFAGQEPTKQVLDCEFYLQQIENALGEGDDNQVAKENHLEIFRIAKEAFQEWDRRDVDFRVAKDAFLEWERRDAVELIVANETFQEGDRRDAVGLIERPIGARELAIEGRPEEEARRVREHGRELATTVKLLRLAEDLLGAWDQHDRAERVGALRSFKEREFALAEIRFAELRLDEVDPDIMAERHAAAQEIRRQIYAQPDFEDPAVLARVDALVTATDSMFAPLSGLEKLAYNARLVFGTDRQGRSVSVRATFSVKVAVQIGAITALISVALGSLLGAAAGFFGGLIDNLVIWLYSTFSSVPNLVLLTVLAYTFTNTVFDATLVPVYVAFCATFWIGPCRVVRGETLKLKELEYVQAATAIGFGRPYILVRHVIPNTAHLMFINFSLLFIGAIKSEVILTYLGLGVKDGASWGIMIKDSAQEVVNGHFWQITTATAYMFVLVLAFNILSDALQDAFDPKHV